MAVTAESMETRESRAVATCRIESGGEGEVRLVLAGPVTQVTVPELWRRVEAEVQPVRGGRVVVEAEGVTALDGAGMALLVRLNGWTLMAEAAYELRGLAPAYGRILERFEVRGVRDDDGGVLVSVPMAEQVGTVTAQM